MAAIPQQRPGTYSLSGWLIDGSSDQLKRYNEVVKLEPKIMQVLLCLIENQGKIVSKDELMQRVWPNVIITDHPLNRSISHLRKIFQDNPRTPRVIETISKKGYRLMLPAKPVPNDHPHFLEEQLLSTLRNDNRRHKKFLIPVFCFVILLLFGNFFPEHANSGQKALQTSAPPVSLTTSIGLEKDVAFSPDSKHLVYMHQDPDNLQWNVYLKTIDGPEKRLTNNALSKRSPSFTPDGKSVSYVEYRNNNSRIVTLSLLDGSEEETLLEANQQILDAIWSPNGRNMVYSMRTSADAPYALFLFSPKTGRKRQLTMPAVNDYADLYPAFSPDGKQVIFSRLDSQYNDDIYIVDIDKAELKRLTYENQVIFGLDWSALNDEIIYCIYDDGVYELKSVNLNGESRSLKRSYSAPLEMRPVISPSGKLLSLEHWMLRKNIYRAEINHQTNRLENEETVITSAMAEWNGKLSPDGKKITFVSDRSGSNQLWLANIDGSNLKKVVDWDVPYNCITSWAPDGRSFVFSVKPADIYLLYRFTLETGKVDFLTSDAAASMHSRDGEWIYFSSMRSGDWRIWKMPAASGPAVQVTHNNGFAAMESVDGKTLFYCKRGTPGIWQKTGKYSEKIVIEDLGIYETQNWLVIKEGIYYLKRLMNGHAELCFYRFSDKSTTPLVHPLLEKHRLDDVLSLSPDGKSIYFSLNDHAESNIKMIELAWE